MDWLEAGASLLGGILGGKESSKGQTTTSQNTIDPRMVAPIYGGANRIGIEPAAYANYMANPSGLNPQMLEGLNRQYQVYSDPNTAQGYSNMQSLGSQLMGAPVAGNPFTSGRASLGSGQGGQQSAFAQPTFSNPAQGTAQAFSPQMMAHPLAVGGGAGGSPATVGGGLLGSNTMQGGNGAGGLLGGNAGGSSSFGGINGNGIPGEGGGWTAEDAINAALNNPGAVNAVAGGLLGPAGGLFSRAVLGLLGNMSAPNTGQINNFGSRNDARQNAGIAAGMNSYGGGGGNASGAGGDSSRGSQSSNGGRNGGDSGGF